MSRYNVLALDGGGIRGIITTRLLTWFEKQLQEYSGNKDARLADYFDYFIGTSTGGLMSLCYLMPDNTGERPLYSAKHVEDLYHEFGKKIFYNSVSRRIKSADGLGGPTHSPKNIEEVLQGRFNDAKLSQLVQPCFITAYDMRTNEVIKFRQHLAEKSSDDDFYLHDIGRATTSAPTYFPPHIMKNLAGREYTMIDGGISGANSSLAGYRELRRIDKGTDPSKMMFLSLGTGKYYEEFSDKEIKSWGKLEWYRPLVNLLSQNMVENTENQMLAEFRDHQDNYMRLNPLLDDPELCKIDLATPENIKNLDKLTDKFIRKNKAQLEGFVARLYERDQEYKKTKYDKFLDLKADRVWLDGYPQDVPDKIDPDKYKNVNEMLDEASLKYYNKVAYDQFGKQLKYSDVHRYTLDLAAFLQNVYEIGPGDRIAIMMPNSLQYPMSIFATLRLGASVININPLYTSEEIANALSYTKPSVMIIWDGCSARVEEAINKLNKDRQAKVQSSINVLVSSLGDLLSGPKRRIINYVLKRQGKMENGTIKHSRLFRDALAEGAKMELNRPKVSGKDIAFLQLTGGTTGLPKAAVLTHRNITSNMQQVSVFINPRLREQGTEQKIGLTALPLYHIFALTVNGMLFYHLGFHNVLVANPRDLPGLMKTLKQYKFNVIIGVNTLFKAMLNHPKFPKLDFSKLILSLGGGMAVQQDVADQWTKITGNQMSQGYGLTEASPVVTVLPYNFKKFDGSIGQPLPSTDVLILDDNREKMPIGENGYLYVRGPQVMYCYLDDKSETRRDLSMDGWLNTGDIAYINEEGYVYIVDRAKDMINVSGFNVFPNEIEAVVDAHPKVYETGCVGVPDENSGEAVKVFVVLNPGESLTEDEVIEFAREKLTGYKRPSYVQFVKELPKTPVGKILRREIRDNQ